VAGGPTGGGLEAHTTGAYEVALRPGVGVLHAHVIAAVVLFAAGEADTDAGGDPHGPGHDRHRRGELDAIALLVGEEVRDRVSAGLLRGIERVLEVIAAEVGLEQNRGLPLVVGIGSD